MTRQFRLLMLVLIAFSITQTSCEKDTAAAAAATTGAGGSLARFAIVGNYLYMVSRYDLEVYDITDPVKPLHKNTAYVGFDVETIFPYDDKLFIGGANGMYIFSISQPDKPRETGMVSHFRACDPVVTKDNIAYVTLRAGTMCGAAKNALYVYDVTDITNPKLLNEVLMDPPGGLGVKQNALYICQGSNGMLILDLANPTKPKAVKKIKDEDFTDVIPYGNVLITYIKGGVSFYDITEPLNPVLLSKVKG